MGKMQGDYHRYLAELPGGALEKNIDEARQAYEQATKEANLHLLTTHPVRLQLALNFSVFQHELLGDRDGAVSTAETASECAYRDLENLPSEVARDAAETLRLLQD